MNKEMQRALELDGEKLRQLTGEDHGPIFIYECENCLGMPEHGCYCQAVGAIAPGGPLMPDPEQGPEVWLDCPECGGEGGWEQHCRVYEHGCGFAHDGSEWHSCDACNGKGGMIREAEGDR